MAYLKCPDCAQLAHVATEYVAVIHCPRCRALHKNVQLLPLDEVAEPEIGPLPSLQPGEL
jgi:phage FluMu protein Com